MVLLRSRQIAPNAADGSGRSGRTAVFKFYGLRDNLREAHPRLDVAPVAVVETAELLLRKLETALRPDETRSPIALPGTLDGRPAWVEDGMVMDLPDLPPIPGLATVPVPPSSRVRAAYGLVGADDRLSQRVVTGDDEIRAPVLPRERRAELVAVLKRAGVSAARTASQLNALQERQVSRIDLEIGLADGTPHVLRDLPFKLMAGDPAVLYMNDPDGLHRVSLARVLADYLGVAGHHQSVALALIAFRETARSLARGEIEEALELLDGDDVETDGSGAADGSGDANAALLDEPDPGLGDAIADPRSGKDADHDSFGGATGRTSGGPTGRTSADATRHTSGGGSRERTDAPVSGASAHAPSGPREREPLPPASEARFGTPRPARFDDDEPAGAWNARTDSESHSPPADGDRAAPAGRSRPPADAQSERDAIAYVQEYARTVLGVVEIRDRQRDRCGWDLEFVYEDGRVELVEVKGSTRFGPFEITKNELEQARERDGYVLYYLAGQLASQPVLYRFDDLGRRIDEDQHLRAAAWSVIGWRELDPAEISVDLH